VRIARVRVIEDRRSRGDVADDARATPLKSVGRPDQHDLDSLSFRRSRNAEFDALDETIRTARRSDLSAASPVVISSMTAVNALCWRRVRGLSHLI